MNKMDREKIFLPCYFFHGEETFLAFQFIQQLRESLGSPEVEEQNVEKFKLDETSWADVVDMARTIPLFFVPCRLIIVEIPEDGKKTLTAKDEDILRDYLSSPSVKNIIIVIFTGKLKRSHALLKFFSSFPPDTVSVREVKPLKEKSLYKWMDMKLASCGKSATMEAKQRLEEVNGNRLARLWSELEKLVDFVGERKKIELDDVNQVSGWAKTFVEYELANSLEEGDFKKSLLVLNHLFREGIKPEFIFGIISNLFRDVFLAKLWLREKTKDRKTIFRELRPQIQEKFGDFYRTKFNDFFSLVEGIPQRALNRYLSELEGIDVSVKTSSASAQTHLEKFLFDFCLLRKKKRSLGG